MLDKKKYKNWQIGDTFALKIKECKYQEYLEKYLLLIYMGDEGDKNFPEFRIKITNDQNIPKTKEEIEKLSYVRTFFTVIENAYPAGTEIPKDVELFPDEYGYLHTYKACFYTTGRKYKVRDDLIYVGNYQLTPPMDEYNPWTSDNIPMCFWEAIENKIIEDYIRYNLRDPELYNFQCANLMHEQAKQINEVIIQTLEDIRNHKFSEGEYKEEEYTTDSLTYVGGDPNHPDYKE